MAGASVLLPERTEIYLFGVHRSMRTLAHARSQINMIETRKREH